MKNIVVAIAMGSWCGVAAAGEGMWTPQQLPQLEQRLGIRAADLAGPLRAVVSLGNCTASFVSADGLIVTNHHCIFGSLQHHSTPERDLIRDGFQARTRAEELPAAPGSRAFVTTKVEDVTARLTGATHVAMGDAERARALDRRKKELIAECERGDGVRCSVDAFFEGLQYLRTSQLELTDVRLVYAPARGIGEFGGEADNFAWPRHSGDFAFLRAYANGQPYRPAHFLKLASKGVVDGSLVIVAGYPGRTTRFNTADEVPNHTEFFYPAAIRYHQALMRILEENSSDRAAQIRNAGRIKSLGNALKNYVSANTNLVKGRVAEAREAREALLPRAIREELSRVHREVLRPRERTHLLSWILGMSGGGYSCSPMLTLTGRIYRTAVERTRKDEERAEGFQDRDAARLRQLSDRTQSVIDPATDRASLRYFLAESEKLPRELRIDPIDRAIAAAGGLEPYLDRLYGGTKIASQDERAAMLNESVAQLDARRDPMLELAASLLPLVEEDERRQEAWHGAMARLRPRYIEALRKVSGALYPDANGTLRVTFGRVEGYAPRDATQLASRTRLAGVLEKHRGERPYDAPAALLAAAADAARTKRYADGALGDVPVNFVASCDAIGGNSGSPTLNAKGELVGVLFDVNHTAVAAQFTFSEALSRSIHVDVAYMLFVLDAVDHADPLLAELGVSSTTRRTARMSPSSGRSNSTGPA